MKCCVPFCGATSDNYPCTVDETNFHEFPSIPWLRKSWLVKIGIKEGYLPQGAVVCSQHFARDDFYWTGSTGTGKRKFRKTAIPSIFPVSNSAAPTFEFCLICLDPDAGKLLPLDNNNIARAYTNLTGLAINVICDHINTVPKLCPECARRLTSCDAFKHKTMRAHFILIQLLQKDKIITAQSLKSVDRVRNALTSNIVKHTFTSNHCDLYLVHNEEDDNKHTKQEENICELEDNIHGNSENSYCDEDANDYEMHNEEINNEHIKQVENIYQLQDNIDGKSEKSDETIHESDKDANDYEIEDIYGKVQGINKIQKLYAGRTNFGEQYENEYDHDIINSERKFGNDYDKINPDISNNAKYTNNKSDVFLNCDSDEAESLDYDSDYKSDHSLKHEGVDEIDFDIDICDGIDEYLNENCSGNKLLNTLKVSKQSENRVSLNNVIFVKDPKPIIQHKDSLNRTDNAHANQNIRKNNDTKLCESKTNEQAINKILTQRNENAKNNIIIVKNNNDLNNQNENKIMNENTRNMKLNNINKPSISINIVNGKIVINPKKRTNLKNKKKLMSDGQLMKTKFLIINSKRRVSATKKVTATKSLRAIQLAPDQYIPRPKTQDCSKIGLKSFTRTWLTYEEQVKELQRRKDSKEYERSPYKCETCYKVFCTPATYAAHMDKHTDKYGKLECAICGVHMKKRPTLKRHMQMHGEVYNCKLCGFRTSNKTIAVNHQRYHDGKTYKCRHCNAEFRKPTSYCSHMRIKHPTNYACALCGYSFISPTGVNVHIKLKHPFDDLKELSGPLCEDCNVRFATEAAYQQHLQVSPKHAVSGNLKRNEPSSKRAFVPYYYYKERRKKPRARPYDKILCEMCGKAFHALISLKEHMCKHTGEKLYKCEICHKQFAYSVTFKAHVRRHSDQTRFTCGVCHKTFSSVSSRLKHLRSHLATRPMYKCMLCDKAYTERCGLDQHISHVHLKVPWPKRNRRDRYRAKAKRPRLERDSHLTVDESGLGANATVGQTEHFESSQNSD